MKKPENLKITVSGVRGVVGDTLTPELLVNFSQAFAAYLKKSKKAPRVVLGRDTRPTGLMVKHCVLSGLVSSGCNVIDIDICATPTVFMMVRQFKADGGIIITASHNPVQWNALKFVDSSGSCLPEAGVKEVIRIYEKKEFSPSGWETIGKVESRPGANEIFIDSILRHVDVKKIRKRGFRVALDCVNGAGSLLTPMMLKKLGCKTYSMNTTPDGIFP